MDTCRSCALIVMTIALLCISTFAKGAPVNPRSKYIAKTIRVDGGDIVDCIDIYKQPAFSHPLLANHTLETEPSKHKSVLTSKNEDGFKIFRSWQKNGRCPYGSIPLIRQNNFNIEVRKTQALPTQNSPRLGHQYAVMEARKPDGTIQGASAIQNVWNPSLNLTDGFSLSQIWLVAGTGHDLNTIEVGWHVYPIVNGDFQTRLFIYWTDMIGLGNWWLYVNGYPIGYWPQALFTSIANGAEVVQWGGEVYDSQGGTWNQMGNGHAPNEGFQRSTYTHGMKYIDSSSSSYNNYSIIQPTSQDLDPPIVTAPLCYGLELTNNSLGELFFFFGGPGCASF